MYDYIWDFAGGEPEDKIILPDPTEPSVIENIFRFHTFFLSDTPCKYGLTGECTWDEEHGIGIVIENNKVKEVGQAYIVDHEYCDAAESVEWMPLILSGDVEGVCKWLQAGGDVNEMNSRFEKPMHIAILHNQHEIFELILKKTKETVLSMQVSIKTL